MFIMIAQLLLTGALGYLTWSLVAMEINYGRASSMNIPLVRLPVDPMNIVWLVLEPLLWRLLAGLPFNFGTFSRYSRRGWHFQDKAQSHLQYGPVWALVTPGDIWVYIADPEAIHDVFLRRPDFIRPSKMYKVLEVFGPCISTAEWTDWPRHRKVLATPFNESIMRFAWDESSKQTREMLRSWTSTDESEIPSIARDTRTLSLNVLAATGFHKSYQFRSSSEPRCDEANTYRDALQTVLDNAIMLMLFPPRLLRLPFLPKSWSRVGKAAAEFKRYMISMLEDETELLTQGKAGTGSIMTSFVRALNTRQQGEAGVNGSESHLFKGLTVEEIFGNIFVINFAGHDTTANTLAFAMLLLSGNPEVQDWIAEEVRAIVHKSESNNWSYSEIFPKLPRCRAVMLETLRLYPPIMALPKWSNQYPQQLKIGDRIVTIPPHTAVMPSLLAIQTHPRYWRESLLWQPSRWIASAPASTPISNMSRVARQDAESLIDPLQGTYFPWSDGPQSCPGAKFAQVEFVAVLAHLFRDHRLVVVQEPNESLKKAHSRALAATEDCDMELLLRMRNPDSVRLACKRV